MVLKHSVLRDQIVLGVASDLVREKLLYENGLTLPSACSIVRACESSSSQLNQISTRSESVNALQGKQLKDTRVACYQQCDGASTWSCRNCGRQHRKGACVAAAITCYRYGKFRHFAKRCWKGEGSQWQQSSSDGRQMTRPTGQRPQASQQPPPKQQQLPAQHGTYIPG